MAEYMTFLVQRRSSDASATCEFEELGVMICQATGLEDVEK
jgi:hypothetical protein